MKFIKFIIPILIFTLVSSCSSVYKKQYDNGFTFLPHKKHLSKETRITPNQQEQTAIILKNDLQKAKETEQQEAERSYHTYHKYLNKIEHNAPGKLLSGINKFTLKKIDALKTDTIYRKEPLKSGSNSEVVQNKVQLALILSVVSLIIFFFVTLLSLIPAIIALTLVSKAKSIAKLSGETLPSDANTARIIAWVTIGLNILVLLLLIFILIIFILINVI